MLNKHVSRDFNTMANDVEFCSELLEEDFDKEIEVSAWTAGVRARLVGYSIS